MWDIPHIKTSEKHPSGTFMCLNCSNWYCECRIKSSIMSNDTGKKQLARTERYICKSPESFKYQIKINGIIRMTLETSHLCTYPLKTVRVIIWVIPNFPRFRQLLISSTGLFGNICTSIWTLSSTEEVELKMILKVYSSVSLCFCTYAAHFNSCEWHFILTFTLSLLICFQII